MHLECTSICLAIPVAVCCHGRLLLAADYFGHFHMETDTKPQELQPKDLTEQRNDALREGVKGLLLINGGGATAMLAFLQAIWTTKPEIAQVCRRLHCISRCWALLGRAGSALSVSSLVCLSRRSHFYHRLQTLSLPLSRVCLQLALGVSCRNFRCGGRRLVRHTVATKCPTRQSSGVPRGTRSLLR